MVPSIPTSRLRLDYQLYRQLGLLVGVSFPTRPHHGIVRDVSSWGYRSRTLPRKECRFFACPRKVSRALHCAPTVSFVGSSRKADKLRLSQTYLRYVTVTPPARLFPLAGLVGTGFDLRVAGLPRTPFLHSMYFYGVGTLYVVWVTVLVVGC